MTHSSPKTDTEIEATALILQRRLSITIDAARKLARVPGMCADGCVRTSMDAGVSVRKQTR